jgi:hypothetical protein
VWDRKPSPYDPSYSHSSRECALPLSVWC